MKINFLIFWKLKFISYCTVHIKYKAKIVRPNNVRAHPDILWTEMRDLVFQMSFKYGDLAPPLFPYYRI